MQIADKKVLSRCTTNLALLPRRRKVLFVNAAMKSDLFPPNFRPNWLQLLFEQVTKSRGRPCSEQKQLSGSA